VIFLVELSQVSSVGYMDTNEEYVDPCVRVYVINFGFCDKCFTSLGDVGYCVDVP